MNYFFGRQSLISVLSSKYVEGKSRSPGNIFLTSAELQKLKKQTDAQNPFDKVDLNLLVGEIDTTVSSEFEGKVVTALNLLDQVAEIQSIRCDLVHTIVKLKASEKCPKLRENGNGLSAHWSPRQIFLSLPFGKNQTEELALNLVHEMGHQALMIYQDIDPLIEEWRQPVYSVVRKTHRPALLSFHALVAVYFMIVLATGLIRQDLSAEESFFWQEKLKELRRDFIEGTSHLRHAKWTELGSKIFIEMIDRVLAEPSGAEVVA